MRSLLLLALLLTLSVSLNAQPRPTQTATTNIYVEILGNGGLYSLNVERLITTSTAARVGLGIWSSEDLFGLGEQTVVTVPVMANYYFGEGYSKIEIGGGLLLGWADIRSEFEDEQRSHAIIDLTGVFGYRYQPSIGGFIFRVGVTPFYSLNSEENAYPDSGLFVSGGVSLGYSF